MATGRARGDRRARQLQLRHPPPHAAVRACRSSLGDALPLGLRAEIRHHVFKKKYKKRVFFCCVSHRDPCVFVARLLHLLSHTIPSPCAIEPHA